jgi:hypothetical protein
MSYRKHVHNSTIKSFYRKIVLDTVRSIGYKRLFSTIGFQKSVGISLKLAAHNPPIAPAWQFLYTGVMSIMDWVMTVAAIALLGVVVREFWGARKIEPKEDPSNKPNQDAIYGGARNAPLTY